MKTSFKKCWSHAALACLIFTAGAGAAYGQIIHVVSTFDSSADINAWSYDFGNPNVPGTTITFKAGDAPAGGPSTGCMVLTSSYGPGGTDANIGITIGLNDFNASTYTAIEMDVKVAPGSALDQYGTACWFQGALKTGGGWNWQGSPGFNLAPVATNNGWMHVIWPASSMGGPPAATNWNDIKALDIDPYDNNYTNAGTLIVEIANVKFTAPAATYPNYAPATFQFNDSSSVVAIEGATLNGITDLSNPWYGETNYVTWSTNDSKGNTNSGSLYISAQFASGNNALVLGIPFDTNLANFEVETNAAFLINAAQYSAIELDVLWDTNNSTVDIDTFNLEGDVAGFPIGAYENSPIPNPTGGGGQDEICGTKTTYIPDAASNSWQHIVCPITTVKPADVQMLGIWFKKWVGTPNINGTVAFWIDNITFDGAVIPTHPNQATVTLAKPVPGLQCNFTGTAGNAQYDREQICTLASGYSFVDATGPVTYSVTYGYTPGTNSSFGVIAFDENGTSYEPDWADESIFKITVTPTNNGTASIVQLQCKTNQANSNGDLYDSPTQINGATVTSNAFPDPTWTNYGPTVGTWSFTISGNTSILCVAPNHDSVTLPFPLGLQSADVEANFPPGNMYVYFGAQGNGAASEGTRWVLQKVSISGGGVTPLSQDFVAEANTGSAANGGEAGPAGSGGNAIPGQGQAWTGTLSGVQWDDTSDSKTANGIYLIGTNTMFSLNWTANAGAGLMVLTNTTAGPSGWGTNATLTAGAYLDATYFSSEVDITNLPTSGNFFFELENP